MPISTNDICFLKTHSFVEYEIPDRIIFSQKVKLNHDQEISRICFLIVDTHGLGRGANSVHAFADADAHAHPQILFGRTTEVRITSRKGEEGRPYRRFYRTAHGLF